MNTQHPLIIDNSLRQLVRETVREVLREELVPLTWRNAGPQSVTDDGFLSVAKAARVPDVEAGTIRAWIRAGRLTTQHPGRVLRTSGGRDED